MAFYEHTFIGKQDLSNKEVENLLKKFDIKFDIMTDEKLSEFISKKISENKIIGWMQGKSEFGPRALGARSILADPRPIDMHKKLNLKIKFRESFRPFAPSVLSEYQHEWFDSFHFNEFMSFISKTKDFKIKDKFRYSGFESLNYIESKIKAVSHVDGTARVQTVYKSLNPKFYNLIENFYKITGVPILINTSFNVRGEPIVETPEDALKCFFGTDLDYLVIENFVINKTYQNKNLITSKYSVNFKPD